MKFTVKAAEAICTGGGFYSFAGITEDGMHFIAESEGWFALTDSPTMTSEMDSDAWDKMWYADWQNANAVYVSQSDMEGYLALIAIYDWLIANGQDHFSNQRDSILSKQFIVKDEFIDEWYGGNEYTGESISLEEIISLAHDWDMPVEALSEQVKGA